MVKVFSYVLGVSFLLFSLLVLTNKQEFKKSPPEISPGQAAVIAYGSYNKHKHGVQALLNQFYENRFTVIAHKEHKSEDGEHKHKKFNTSVIVVKDNHTAKSYVAIEGGHNSHDTTSKDQKKIHKIIHDIKEKNALTIAALIGHTRGGVLAKKIAREYASAYAEARVIGFNSPELTNEGTCYRYKTPKNEIYFACKQDDWKQATDTLFSYGGDTIELHASQLVTSEKKEPMKCFLKPLEDKSWQDVIK